MSYSNVDIKQEKGSNVAPSKPGASTPNGGVMTVGEMLQLTLMKFKKYINELQSLTGHAIVNKINGLSVEETVEWVIWLTENKKSLEGAIVDLFSDYGLKISILKREELEKIKKFFEIFQKSTNFKYQ